MRYKWRNLTILIWYLLWNGFVICGTFGWASHLKNGLLSFQAEIIFDLWTWKVAAFYWIPTLAISQPRHVGQTCHRQWFKRPPCLLNFTQLSHFRAAFASFSISLVDVGLSFRHVAWWQVQFLLFNIWPKTCFRGHWLDGCGTKLWYCIHTVTIVTSRCTPKCPDGTTHKFFQESTDSLMQKNIRKGTRIC